MAWETVIGLEIHAQLATESKIFSGASTEFGAEPNRQACAIDMALPGVLPVLNEEAVRLAVKFGLAIGAEIGRVSVFDRKNYFYPDLPKGYQVSQFHAPIVGRGSVDIVLPDGTVKTIGVTRAHLEEDAGKSLHEDFHGMTGIDLNRAGTPLLEIVSEPDMRSAAEAVAYLRYIHSSSVTLGICDGNMEKANLRCDANVSVRPAGSTEFGTRAEIKNVNSFRYIEKAIEFEVDRQIDLIESGGSVVQESRLYDSDRDETRSMRSKEGSDDYRYFPEPDLLPVELSEEWIQAVADALPELPRAKQARYVAEFELSESDATALVASLDQAAWFETATAACGNAKLAANWLRGEVAAALNRDGVDLEAAPIDAEKLGGLLQRIEDGTISGRIAKEVFEKMWADAVDADTVIERDGLRQVTDTGAIEALVDEVLAANPEQVAQFRAGKDKVFGFLVGQVMKASKGKANPGQANELLRAKIAAMD